MTFGGGARSGGFGSIGQGPFRTGQGGFGQYLIGDDGASLERLRLQSATIGWGNGTVTDSAYLATLEWYLGRQEKGTTEWNSAKDDLDDARYSIGRNRIVNGINRAATTDQRVAGLSKLIRYDQRRLRGMKAENEQARELRERISDAEAQIRDARYGDQVRAFNDHRRTTDQMLRYARRMAAESRGSPDADQWTDRVSEWEDRRWDERFDEAKANYEKVRATVNGDIRGAGEVLTSMLEARLAKMGAGTPGYKQYQRALRDQRSTITEDVWARRAANMRVALDTFQASPEDYIAFLHERVNALPKGTQARAQARSELLSETFRIGNERVEQQLASGDLEPGEAIDFYQGYLATMQPTAEKYGQIMDRIRQLRLDAVTAVPFGAPAERTGLPAVGRRIAPSGGTGGVGFVSQYDGSAFATQNCVYASAAMMLDALGGPDVSGADIRRYAGDTEGFGMQSDVQGAYEELGFATDRYNGMAFRKFTKRLEASEGGAMVIGLLSMLPEQYRITGSGAHAVYVTKQTRQGPNGETYRLVMDPLGRAGYRGDWWPDSALQRFAWSGVRNPLTGTTIYGSVVFGKRTGKSNVRYTPRGAGYTPRFQAFDTDANGKSTVGRGGGTSREEAGPPKDWRKGRAGTPAGRRGGATTDADVEAFLDAVGKIDRGPSLDESGRDVRGTPQEQRSRAKAILGEYAGDVRLATLAWFGLVVEPDTSLWSQTDRWYVNSVATAMGYDKVPPQGVGVLEPGKPPAPKDAAADVIPGLDASKPHRRRPDAGDVNPAAGAAANALAERLGWPPTPLMERAIIAWMTTDSPGEEIVGNNPFGVTTVGNHDLPGQIGVDENGRAIFDSMEHGIDAVAGELEREFPEIVAAGNTGDPRKLLTTLDGSGYREGGYGGALVPAYNAQPGEDTMVAGGGLLDVPPNLGQMSGQHSDIADLFAIDPRDPAQIGWLERNLASAKESFDKGLGYWMFESLGGTQTRLDFHPDMYAQLASTRADYAQVRAETEIDTNGDLAKSAASFRQAAMGAAAELVMEDVDRNFESLEMARDKALRTGDYAGAMNASLAIIDGVRTLLQIPPGEVVDVEAFRDNVPALDAADIERLKGIVESIDPDSPTGDPLLKLAQDERVVIETDGKGGVASVTIPPEVAFVTFTPEGEAKMVTDRSNPDMFQPVTQYDQNDEPFQAPWYSINMVQVSLTMPDGGVVTGRIAKEPGQVPAVVLDYANYRPPPMPGQQQQGGGGLIDDLADMVTSAVGNVPDLLNLASGLPLRPEFSQQGASPTQPAAAQQPTARQPWDAITRTFASQLPVQRITYTDPVTREVMDFYSLDGKRWIGGERDRLSSAPPQLVLNADSGIIVGGTREEPTFRVGGKDYTVDTLPGGITSVFHWYGEDPRDNPNPYAAAEVGAPGRSGMRIIDATPAPGGGVTLDVLTDTRSRREQAYDIARTTRQGGGRLLQELSIRDARIVDQALAGATQGDRTLIARQALAQGDRTYNAPGMVPYVRWAGSGFGAVGATIGARLGAVAASANANQVSARARADRAVLEAKERTAAIRARNAMVARRAQPTARPTARPSATPVPAPVGSAAPRPTPRASQFTPRPATAKPMAPGQSQQQQRRFGTVAPQPQPKPTPGSGGVGPRRV